MEPITIAATWFCLGSIITAYITAPKRRRILKTPKGRTIIDTAQAPRLTVVKGGRPPKRKSYDIMASSPWSR